MWMLAWLMAGLAAGVAVDVLMPRDGRGRMLISALVGAAGALLGGFIAVALRFSDDVRRFDGDTFGFVMVAALAALVAYVFATHGRGARV